MKAIFAAKMESLTEMLSWVVSGLKSSGFDAKTLNKIEVATEEALVNIIQHSYKTSPEPIEIELKRFSGHIEILIKDQGPAFNPLDEETKIEEDLPLEDRPIGGLGIHLMKQCMDEVRYAREGNTNLLSLIKKIALPEKS